METNVILDANITNSQVKLIQKRVRAQLPNSFDSLARFKSELYNPFNQIKSYQVFKHLQSSDEINHPINGQTEPKIDLITPDIKVKRDTKPSQSSQKMVRIVGSIQGDLYVQERRKAQKSQSIDQASHSDKINANPSLKKEGRLQIKGDQLRRTFSSINMLRERSSQEKTCINQPNIQHLQKENLFRSNSSLKQSKEKKILFSRAQSVSQIRTDEILPFDDAKQNRLRNRTKTIQLIDSCNISTLQPNMDNDMEMGTLKCNMEMDTTQNNCTLKPNVMHINKQSKQNIQSLKIELEEEDKIKVKKAANQESFLYSKLSRMVKLLQKERLKSVRFVSRTERNKQKIEKELKQSNPSLQSNKLKEQEAIHYIMQAQIGKEQVNKTDIQDQDALFCEMEERVANGRVKYLASKLKQEKDFQYVQNSAKRIRYLKFFDNLEKDSQSLVQPIDFNNENEKSHKPNRPFQTPLLKDSLHIDFFQTARSHYSHIVTQNNSNNTLQNQNKSQLVPQNNENLTLQSSENIQNQIKQTFTDMVNSKIDIQNYTNRLFHKERDVTDPHIHCLIKKIKGPQNNIHSIIPNNYLSSPNKSQKKLNYISGANTNKNNDAREEKQHCSRDLQSYEYVNKYGFKVNSKYFPKNQKLPPTSQNN